MVTINPDIVAAHAQHAHLYSTQLKSAQDHASHDALWSGIALGIVGQMLQPQMSGKLYSFSETMGALSDKGAEVGTRIDTTAKIHQFTEQANTELMGRTRTQINDPDLFHVPHTINDFPDSGIVSDIGSFASNCPQYSQAGSVAVTLGAVSLALDALGLALDPVGNMFGMFAGVIIDLVWPLKEVLDLLAGDPGALQDASATFDQIAQFLSETAHTYGASLSEITPAVWDEPGASDVYLRAANNLVQLAITAGSGAEDISGDLLIIGSFLGDLRAGVFDHIVGLVAEMLITAATGIAFSIPTFGASIAAAVGFMEAEAAFTTASIAIQLAAAVLRATAAAQVADTQAQNYDKLVADIRK